MSAIPISRSADDDTDYPTAYQSLNAALTLALDAGARTDEAYCRQEIGFLLLDTGGPRLALGDFHAVLALAPCAVMINLAGNGLNGIGVALLQLDRAAQAVPFLLAALAIRAEIEDLEQQHVDLVHLAAAALALGNPTITVRIARFLEGHPGTAAGMYGHDRRTPRAVLDATVGPRRPRSECRRGPAADCRDRGSCCA